MRFSLFFFIVVLCSCTKLGFFQNPEVNTTSGVLIGVTNPDVHSFYSVRYGQVLDEDLRFKPSLLAVYSEDKLNVSVPTYRRCWESWLNCNENEECTENENHFGVKPVNVTRAVPRVKNCSSPKYSEDCLFLDINVPTSVDLTSEVEPVLPVLFWIHGGAFSFGSGTELKYDGRYLANNTNTIVVSINYRLDALGCLVFEEEGVSFDGNQGIKDQQLALQWVHENIENFGGNKRQITIFGESAGGQSVTMHLMSPKSKPYFKQAIIQSYRAAIYYQTKEQAKRKTQALLSALNCNENKLQCLREASPISLMKAHDFVVENASENFFDRTQPYRPILDGFEFTEPPLKYFQSVSDLDADLKIIIGTTSDEAASIKVEFKDEILTKEKFFEQNLYYAGPYYGPLAAQEYMKYAEDPDDPLFDYTDILAQEVTDMMFVCPNRALARFLDEAIDYSLSSLENIPVYHYVFNDAVNADNCEDILDFEAPTQCYYASHAAELYYVFNSGPTTGLVLTEEAQSLANLTNDMWGHFARHGSPTCDYRFWQGYIEVIFWTNNKSDVTIVEWPSLNMTASGSMQINEYRRDACDFWDSLGFYFDFSSSSTTQAPAEETTSGTINFSMCFLLLIFFLCCCFDVTIILV